METQELHRNHTHTCVNAFSFLLVTNIKKKSANMLADDATLIGCSCGVPAFMTMFLYFHTEDDFPQIRYIPVFCFQRSYKSLILGKESINQTEM